jgi:TonB-linked SusC/RagA family outer membrane protein
MKSILKLIFFLCIFLQVNTLFAQSIKVSGKITTKEDGQTLPGVNIVIVGTTKGSVSDINGTYIIETKIGDFLLFTSVGYLPQKIEVTGSNQINVILEAEDKTIDELVVIGYGTRKKSDLIGSVASVKTEQLASKPTSDLQSMLKGQLPGVFVSLGTTGSSARPGGSSSVVIRGVNSLMDAQAGQPLYVVDGIPIDDINQINIDDVENISVLKDASAQGIYGARASNGVILITTRRGNESKGKINVKYESYVSYQNVKPNFRLFSPEEYLNVRREANRSLLASSANQWRGVIPNDSTIFTPTELQSIKDGKMVNWLDYAYKKNAPVSKHDISISGGNEFTKYSASLTYFNQDGVRYSSGYKRYSGKLTLDQKISDWFKVGLSAYYLNYKQDVEPLNSDWTDFIVFSPVCMVKDETGNLILYPLGDGKSVNPLYWSTTEYSNTTGDRGIYNGYFEITPVPLDGLKYRLNLSADSRGSLASDFASMSDPSPSKYYTKGHIQVVDSKIGTYLVENILTYEKKIKEIHRFDLTLMQSAYKHNDLSTTTIANLLGNDFQGVNSLGSAIQSAVGRGEAFHNVLSYMGRVNYILADKYMINFTVRADGSSVFGANNKWGYFPSVGLAWNMNKEGFMNSFKWIQESKVRLSYGQIGNEAISPYQSLALASQIYYVSNGIPIVGYSPSATLPNPNLKWETTSTLNLGYDFSFFKGRISGSIEAYKRITTNLLANRKLPTNSGYSSMPFNMGEIENKGIEIGISGVVLSNKDFKCRAGVNFTMNRNKLNKGYLKDANGNYIDDINNKLFIGHPISVYYDYQFDGIWQLSDTASIATSAQPDARPGDVRVKDVDGDGKITTADQVIIDRGPKWYTTFNASVSYKGIDLSADFYWVVGVVKQNLFMSDFNSGGTMQGDLNGIYRDYWTPENPSNTMFRPNKSRVTPYASALNYKNASYFRMTNITLAYTLPQSWTTKVKISKAKAYIRFDNLWTLTSYQSISPEINPTSYPETVNSTFGLSLTF